MGETGNFHKPPELGVRSRSGLRSDCHGNYSGYTPLPPGLKKPEPPKKVYLNKVSSEEEIERLKERIRVLEANNKEDDSTYIDSMLTFIKRHPRIECGYDDKKIDDIYKNGIRRGEDNIVGMIKTFRKLHGDRKLKEE